MKKLLFKISALLFFLSYLLSSASANIMTQRLEDALTKEQNNSTVVTFGKDSGISASEISKPEDEIIIIFYPKDEKSINIDASFISFLEANGIPYNMSENLLEIYVYPNKLGQDKIKELMDKIETLSNVYCADRSYPVQPMEIVSEGRNAINATKFVLDGVDGKGIKIAILDEGFKGYKDLQKRGELPQNLVLVDKTTGAYTESNHGSACAEIIYDIVPAAEMYLFKVRTYIDFQNAISDCSSKGIQILSCSIGFNTPSSFMAGGDLLDRDIDSSINNFLCVVAAGNEARKSWFGSFKKSGGTKYARFPNGSSFLDVTIPIDAYITLVWNDYNNASTYTIEVYDQQNNYIGASNSIRIQVGQVQKSIFNSSHPTKLRLKIRQDSDTIIPEGREMRLIFDIDSTNSNEWTQQVDVIDNSVDRNPESSLCVPADARQALTVGAVDVSQYGSGPIAPYSSRGPTRTNSHTGGRQVRKPDIVAPTGVTTASKGNRQFVGTSAAAPHVAGAAVLLLSLKPTMSMGDLKAEVIKYAQQIQNSPNDTYGYGKLVLNTNLIPSNDVGDFVCYPNPASISAKGYVKITNLPFNTDVIDIQVYTVTGEFVKSFEARDLSEEVYTSGIRRRMLKWDLRNQDGNCIAPGVYFVIVKTLLGSKQVKKIAVKV